MTTKKSEPKKKGPESKLGPIPLENFSNDIPSTPEVDTSPGSLYDQASQDLDKAKPKK